jgi:hypothetical protein
MFHSESTRPCSSKWARRTYCVVALLAALSLRGNGIVLGQAGPPRTPTETAQEFYKELREKRFREAFAISIFKPVVDAMSAADFEDFRVDFDRMAANVPAQLQFTGEQVSGDTATVFMKVPDAEQGDQPEPLDLILVGGVWIVGSKDAEVKVRKAGKDYFLNARIEVHQEEAKTMLGRITAAQVLYSAQHDGQFADIPKLISLGFLPKDIEATDSTGYRFHLSLSKDAKSYTAGAEPERYGRTGRLSFYLDRSGVKSGDTGGKPLPSTANRE